MTSVQPAGAGDAGAPPVCYRHPDRVAYVRCQRCNRPICPECQRPAAVGVQCPQCVKQAESRIGPARSALGAPMREGKPIVTITLMALCVVAFIGQFLAPGMFNQLAFTPAWAKAEPWTFLTSAFLHWGIWHILLNMYALWVVGSYLEQILGRARYLALYLVSALGGSVCVLLIDQPSLQQGSSWVSAGTAGASGAIFGLFATILMVTKRLGHNASGIYTVIGINVVFNLVSVVMGGALSWQGHLGGFVTGLALGAAYAFAPKERRKAWSIGATVLVVAVLVGLILWKFAIVPAQYFA